MPVQTVNLDRKCVHTMFITQPLTANFLYCWFYEFCLLRTIWLL